MNNYENAKKILKKYNQQQVISIADKMPQEKQEMLAEQVLKIDFEELKELYEKTFENIYVDLEQLENQKCQIDAKIQEIDLSLKDINSKLSNNITVFDTTLRRLLDKKKI